MRFVNTGRGSRVSHMQWDAGVTREGGHAVSVPLPSSPAPHPPGGPRYLSRRGCPCSLPRRTGWSPRRCRGPRLTWSRCVSSGCRPPAETPYRGNTRCVEVRPVEIHVLAVCPCLHATRPWVELTRRVLNHQPPPSHV